MWTAIGGSLVGVSLLLTWRTMISMNKRLNEAMERIAKLEGRLNGTTHD